MCFVYSNIFGHFVAPNSQYFFSKWLRMAQIGSRRCGTSHSTGFFLEFNMEMAKKTFRNFKPIESELDSGKKSFFRFFALKQAVKCHVPDLPKPQFAAILSHFVFVSSSVPVCTYTYIMDSAISCCLFWFEVLIGEGSKNPTVMCPKHVEHWSVILLSESQVLRKQCCVHTDLSNPAVTFFYYVRQTVHITCPLVCLGSVWCQFRNSL